MRTNIIKAVGGQLYVAPTFVATNSTTIVCTAVTTSTVSFTITDSTAINSLTYGGANWNSGSKIQFTAKITSNNVDDNPPIITFSSAEGTLTSNMNANTHNFSFTVNYTGASTYFKVAASTNLTYSDMSVMMYQIKTKNSNNEDVYYPVGIYIKSYGNDNKNSYIDVYGGTTVEPNARLGLLNGLKDPDDPDGIAPLTIDGATVTGWGLMSSYAYLKGRIVSKSGTIGGWDIGANTLSSRTLGVDGMWLSTENSQTAVKFAGASSALSNWRFGIGSKFGVLNDGTMYCSNAIISGQLNANTGTFGGSSGFTIATNKLYSNGKSSAASTNNGIYIQSGSSGGIYLGACNSTSQICPFQVTAEGALNATNANISGNITATSGSIGSWTINGTNLEQRDMMSGTSSYYYSSGFGNKTVTGINDTVRLWAGWIENDPSLLPEGEDEEISTDEPYKPFYVTSRGVVHAASGSVFGNMNRAYVAIDDTSFDMYYGNSSILHFGYGNGVNLSGTTSTAPYYTIGTRQQPASLEESVPVGNYSFGVGYSVTASGFCSMAIGFQLTSSANYSVATGFSTTASGFSSTAIGDQTISSGRTSTAMGFKTQASGDYSTSMGRNVIASGDYSFAVGIDSIASGYSSISIGGNAIASGWGSIAMGRNVISSGDYSFATGLRTIVSNMCNVVIGKYNRATRSGSGTDDNPYIYTDPGDYALIIGNGTGDETENRSNALTVDWDGNLWIAGTLKGKIGAQYGTSSTTASTQVKSVTCDGFQLYNGALITIKFSTANTYASGIVKLNINSTGEKNIWVAGAVTGTSNQLLWGANATITFRYDGAEFIVIGDPVTYYGASTTAASTAAKTDTTACTSAVIRKGVVVRLSMTNANTAASPTLNINGTGAKAIYASLGTSTRPLVSNGLSWTDGSTVGFVFDGQYWRVGETAGLASAYVAQTTATNAAKTATDYITPVTIDNNNYIRIHNASDTTGAITVDQNGNLVASGSVTGTNIVASGSVSDADGSLGVKVVDHGFVVQIGSGNNGTGTFTLSSAESSGYLTTNIVQIWPMGTWTNANATVAQIARSGSQITVTLASMSAQQYSVVAQVLYRG